MWIGLLPSSADAAVGGHDTGAAGQDTGGGGSGGQAASGGGTGGGGTSPTTTRRATTTSSPATTQAPTTTVPRFVVNMWSGLPTVECAVQPDGRWHFRARFQATIWASAAGTVRYQWGRGGGDIRLAPHAVNGQPVVVEMTRTICP